MNPEILARLQENLEKMLKAQTNTEIAALDTEFHDLIFRASGMPRLQQLRQCIRFQIELWLNQMQVQFKAHYDVTQLNARTHAAHSSIVEYLIQGDSAGAAERSRIHLNSWIPVVDARKSRREQQPGTD